MGITIKKFKPIYDGDNFVGSEIVASDVPLLEMKCSRDEYLSIFKKNHKVVALKAPVKSKEELSMAERLFVNPNGDNITLLNIGNSKLLDYDDEKEEIVLVMNSRDQLVDAWLVNREGKVIKGRLRHNPVKTAHLVVKPNGSAELYQSIEVLERVHGKDGFLPSKIDNTFILKVAHNQSLIESHRSARSSYAQPLINKNYEADSSNPAFRLVTEAYEQIRKSIPVTLNMEKLWALLGGKSFGIEYEVAVGNVNSAYLGHCGLVPVIDGSIGTEYFQEYPTVILNDVRDLRTIQQQCQVLQDACTVDQRCALHLHIGNIHKDPRIATSLYILAFRIQEEMFSIVHPYKRDEIGTLKKAKNYSRPLIDLGLENYKHLSNSTRKNDFKDAYAEIYECFTTMDSGSDKDENEVGRPWSRKWHCPTRYQWFNMVNYVLGKDGTIEIRLLPPSLDFDTIMPWLVLNTLIIRYAETYSAKVIAYHDKITLSDIINAARDNFGKLEGIDSYYDKVANYLQRWVSERKHHYRQTLKNINRQLVGGTTEHYPQRIGQHAINELTGKVRMPVYGFFNPENPNETFLDEK